MSAPDTNTKREEQKHKPALIGIRGAVIFAFILLAGMVTWLFVQPEATDNTAPSATSTTE